MLVVDTLTELVDQYGDADALEKKGKKDKEKLRAELLREFGTDAPDMLCNGERYTLKAATRVKVTLNQDSVEQTLKQKDLYDGVAVPKITVADPHAVYQLIQDFLTTMEAEGLDTSSLRQRATTALPIERLEVPEEALERLHRTGALTTEEVTSMHDVETTVVLTSKPR